MKVGGVILNIKIKNEEEKQWRAVEELTRKAFWKDEYIEKIGVGCDEHYLAHTLRTAPEFIPDLDFVAEVEGKLVGNVMYSMAYVIKPDGSRHDVLNFGPLSVLPEYQKQGVGSALMEHSLKKAKEMGYGSVIFFGHPTYYPRFGFKEAKEFGITTNRGDNYPAFMAMELIPGDLDGVTGKYYECPLYHVDDEKAREFDENFRN